MQCRTCTTVNIVRIDSAEASIVRLLNVQAALARIHKITAILSKVCGTGLYLDVSPKVLWVSEEEIKQLMIKSNVNWFID